MNLFNRLIVTLLAGLLTAGGAFVFGAAYGWPAASALQGLPALLALRADLVQLPALWTAGGGLACTLLGVVGLYFELRAPGQKPGMVIQRDKLGSLTVSLAGLRRLAEHVVADIPGVETVRADARATRDGVAYHCRVVLSPDSSSPDVAEEIRARLGAAVSHHLGRRAARIDIYTQVGQPQNTRKRVR